MQQALHGRVQPAAVTQIAQPTLPRRDIETASAERTTPIVQAEVLAELIHPARIVLQRQLLYRSLILHQELASFEGGIVFIFLSRPSQAPLFCLGHTRKISQQQELEMQTHNGFKAFTPAIH
ncbi:MAG: hypothetical protein OIF58_08865 [Cohaesibacter sp.]|nr:hypothetical protein [Cohaesibacter sp.]